MHYIPSPKNQSDPFYPRFWEERLESIRKIRKPIGIFLDDMSDWMGEYWPKEWTEMELQVMRDCPQHRFYTLTKQPQQLPQWSPFPENCWVGVTATNTDMAVIGLTALSKIEAKVKYVSFEPLLSRIPLTANGLSDINWLIIGACTGTMTNLLPLHHKTNLAMIRNGNKWILAPQVEWVQEIVEAADKAGIRVFLKNNLEPLLEGHSEFWEDIPQGDHPNYDSIAELRQEMPK